MQRVRKVTKTIAIRSLILKTLLCISAFASCKFSKTILLQPTFSNNNKIPHWIRRLASILIHYQYKEITDMKSQLLNKDTSKLLNHKPQGASNKPIRQTLTKWLGCMMLCITPIAHAAVPSNDLIENAIEIIGPDAVVSGTTIDATVDTAPTCGTNVSAPGVWYKTSVVGDVLRTANTCNNTSYDSKISVYTRDGVGALSCITGNDDACGVRSEVEWDSGSGQEYYILVHGFSSATGTFDLTLNSIPVPANDLIENAIEITGPNAVVSGTTLAATVDTAPNCGTSVTAPGVWYKTSLDGVQFTANTCNNTNYDSKISVYTRDGVGALSCITANDDACSLQSEVEWDSDSGEEYFILVHGFGSARGTFDLTLTGEDIRPPTITAPADITVESTGNLTSVTLGVPSVTDNIDPAPAVTNNSPVLFPLGVTTVTWTATDAANNAATADQTITILPCTDLTNMVCVQQTIIVKRQQFCNAYVYNPATGGYLFTSLFGFSQEVQADSFLISAIEKRCGPPALVPVI